MVQPNQPSPPPQQAVPPPVVTPPAPPPPSTQARNQTLFWLTTAVIVVGLVWFLLWFFYWRFYESTDDANVNGNLINIKSVIPGAPIAFFADDTDLVKQGQLLVLLDHTPYNIRYELEKAKLGSTVLQVRQLFDQVRVSQSNVAAKKIMLSRAQYDFENRQALAPSLAISNEDFTHAQDSLNIAKTDLQLAEDQLQLAQAAAGNTDIENHPLIASQKQAVKDAFYNLKHCSIYAPATGFVAQRNVNVGQWVTPTTSMMAIIPIDYMWVDANYKETQLANMRIGQPATVVFDIFGDRVEFTGKVLGIASGTGSVFSLIPPQNATGNWIKIVQRLPVRISLDPEQLQKNPLRLGLSAYTTVNITNTELPVLAQEPNKRVIGKTYVFQLDFSEVEEEIEEMIQANLSKPLPMTYGQ